MRKSTRLGQTKVYSIAPWASNGLSKLDGTLLPTAPGAEAAALAGLAAEVRDALRQDGAVILAGERLATAPGALSAVAALAADTGAALAWVPRRAGEMGAIDAGALPNLLPGGRPVTDAAARGEVAAVWGTEIPTAPGRDLAAILTAAADRSLGALLVGGIDPADVADPALAARALERVGFVVSLEVRHSAVTEQADVVLPVAPTVEKAGRYVTWEGRRRPFARILETTAISDGQVLDSLADELDVVLGLRTADAARDELARLGAWAERPAAPTVAAPVPVRPGPGEALLASWAEVLDAGRMQDGDQYLAATAKTARAVLSPATAAGLGVSAGETVSVSSGAGSVQVPVQLGAVVDGVVWLPANAADCAVRPALRTVPGTAVRVTRAAAAVPVIAADPDAAAGGER
jgi:NADH-quinone oxidoreductase subunit G